MSALEECAARDVRQHKPHDLPPYSVHRLDMATSGLIVFALTKAMQRWMSEAFARRFAKKVYTAVVHAGPDAQWPIGCEGVVNSAIEPVPESRLLYRAVPSDTATSDPCTTRYRVLRTGVTLPHGCSYPVPIGTRLDELQLEPVTGRYQRCAICRHYPQWMVVTREDI
jgi:23S rRNA-/tRNA-specific pseudouridylate synthase